MLFTSRRCQSKLRNVWAACAVLALIGTQVNAATSERSKTVRRTTSRTPAKLTSRVTKTYVPAHERTSTAGMRVVEEEAAPVHESDGEIVTEDVFGEPGMMVEGDMHMNGMMDGMADDCGCEGPCHHQQACLIPCPGNLWDNLELFGGAHGFTGPLNRGETGSFGFHEGVNWGAPIPCLCPGEWGMQAGARFTHSNFNGAEFSDEDRSQAFVTAGVFRRVDWGLQGGVVMDYLREDWYLETDLAQIRGELSWVYPCRHEVGFWFTTNTQQDTVQSRVTNGTAIVTTTETLQSTDLYAFFYRHRIDESGSANGRIFAGFTGESDGFLGADINVPLNDCWAIQSGFAYLVPEENSHVEESWNFALGIAWRPGGGFQCGKNYYRPLFDVAHNGNFMVDRD